MIVQNCFTPVPPQSADKKFAHGFRRHQPKQSLIDYLSS